MQQQTLKLDNLHRHGPITIYDSDALLVGHFGVTLNGLVLYQLTDDYDLLDEIRARDLDLETCCLCGSEIKPIIGFIFSRPDDTLEVIHKICLVNYLNKTRVNAQPTVQALTSDNNNVSESGFIPRANPVQNQESQWLGKAGDLVTITGEIYRVRPSNPRPSDGAEVEIVSAWVNNHRDKVFWFETRGTFIEGVQVEITGMVRRLGTYQDRAETMLFDNPGIKFLDTDSPPLEMEVRGITMQRIIEQARAKTK